MKQQKLDLEQEVRPTSNLNSFLKISPHLPVLTSLFLQDLQKALQPDLQDLGTQVSRVNTESQEINLAEAPGTGGRAHFTVSYHSS